MIVIIFITVIIVIMTIIIVAILIIITVISTGVIIIIREQGLRGTVRDSVGEAGEGEDRSLLVQQLEQL